MISKKCVMESVEQKHVKAGRPLKTIKKDIRAAVRFSKTEYFIVQTKADKAGLKISAYIREVAINTEIKPRLSDEERQFVRQLIGISNNINQLAKTAHKEGLVSALQYFEIFKIAIDDFLNRFRHA
jgi:mobilization protein NikA